MNPSLPSPGLSAAEVAERVASGRVNRVRRSPFAEYADIVGRNVFTLFNFLVVPAAITLFLLARGWDDNMKAAFAVSGFALFNTALGLMQELRAKRLLDRLTLLAEARVRVVREGVVSEIPAGEVVADDVILISAGDSVVADGALLDARYFEVDEALLTGESDPVPRKVGDKILSGSFCVAGEGAYRAEQVGAAAFAQKTASEARSYRYTASPLEASINRIIEVLTVVAVVLSLSYVALYYLVGGFDISQLVKMIAATITSMVPQGLVLMATLAFLLAAVRMTAKGALVNRLAAVESMAAIDTLCMDKTGTLTTNRLKLAETRIVGERSEVEATDRIGLFASLSMDRDSKSLVALRAALGESKGERLDQLPFKSQNRYSAVRVRCENGELILAMGAAESLQPFLEGDGWRIARDELMALNLRVLMFAEVVSMPRPRFDGSLDGCTLRAFAVIGLSDELRPEAGDVLRHLAEQQIDFKILSGDNPDTVKATVTPLGGVLAETHVVSGAELETASNPDELIRTRHIFGRVSPWQKVQIVRTLTEQGRQVAMIGDGVNDVLPIKTARLGVAMGDGSRASKTVAGIVLTTNDFALLPRLLDEGRIIIRNLRRSGKLFLNKNVYMLPLIILGMLLFSGGGETFFPFDPQQVTLLNFLTIGIPALLITLDHDRAGPSRGSYALEVGLFALRTGLVTGIIGLGVVWLARSSWLSSIGDDPVRRERTMLLSTLILLGWLNLWRALRDGESGAPKGDHLLLVIPVVGFGLYFAILAVPFARDYFNLVWLGWERWLWVIGATALGFVVLRVSDLAFRRDGGRQRQQASGAA